MSGSDFETDFDLKETQTEKYMEHLHKEYDELLKEGEIARQRLVKFKEAVYDIKRWAVDFPSTNTEESQRVNVNDVNVLSFTIPLSPYINKEFT